MTSGQFTTVPLSKIWVDRAGRQRKELHNVDTLADSINRLGLIHPPVITRDYELKAGERRLEAVRSLGWTAVPVQFVDELDPTFLKLLELEENTKRVDLSWQENCAAVSEYHELQVARDPAWNLSRTATALGESVSSIQQKVMVVKESKGSPLVAKAAKLSTAINTAKRVVERRREASLSQFDDTPQVEAPFINADFTEWLESYSGPKFNFIHCDFPYGINFHEHDRQGTVRMDEVYEDSFDSYSRLVDALARVPYTESAHLLFWFSMEHYHWTFEALSAQGWKLNRFPLIWSKGNAGIVPDSNRGPRRVYETAFMASRGDRKIVELTTNHIAFWSEERRHQSEKPKEVLRHFFKMFIDEYSVVLDPTCGSGNAITVAESMGAKHVLGIEKNEEFWKQAVAGYNAA